MKHQSLERQFVLPFGYEATFVWNAGLEVHWKPDTPRILKRRARNKLFGAYRAARREFFEEVAVLVGGNILVVDTDLETVSGTEVIHMPTIS
jgi:hypothetical protein